MGLTVQCASEAEVESHGNYWWVWQYSVLVWLKLKDILHFSESPCFFQELFVMQIFHPLIFFRLCCSFVFILLYCYPNFHPLVTNSKLHLQHWYNNPLDPNDHKLISPSNSCRNLMREFIVKETLAPTRDHIPSSPYCTTNKLKGEVCLW